jgi:hypothetical protein
MNKNRDVVKAFALVLIIAPVVSGCHEPTQKNEVICDGGLCDESDGTNSPAETDFSISFDVPDGSPNTNMDDSVSYPSLGIIGRIEIIRSGNPVDWGPVMVRARFFDRQVLDTGLYPLDFYDATLRLFGYVHGKPQPFVREGCKTFSRGKNAYCFPLCSWDEYCNILLECKESPKVISAGQIKVTVGAFETEMIATELGYEQVEISQADIKEGTPIVVTTKGDDLPGFSIETEGIDPLKVDLPSDTEHFFQLLVDTDQFSWSHTGTGLVQLFRTCGFHAGYAEHILSCETPDTVGDMPITPNMQTNCSSMNSSWISHIKRTQIQLPQGIVELLISYKWFFGYDDSFPFSP